MWRHLLPDLRTNELSHLMQVNKVACVYHILLVWFCGLITRFRSHANNIRVLASPYTVRFFPTGSAGRFSFFLMRKCIAFDFILLYQRTLYLLFPINYFLKMYRVSFILGVYSLKCTKQSVIGVHPCFSVFIHRK